MWEGFYTQTCDLIGQDRIKLYRCMYRGGAYVYVYVYVNVSLEIA